MTEGEDRLMKAVQPIIASNDVCTIAQQVGKEKEGR